MKTAETIIELVVIGTWFGLMVYYVYTQAKESRNRTKLLTKMLARKEQERQMHMTSKQVHIIPIEFEFPTYLHMTKEGKRAICSREMARLLIQGNYVKIEDTPIPYRNTNSDRMVKGSLNICVTEE